MRKKIKIFFFLFFICHLVISEDELEKINNVFKLNDSTFDNFLEFVKINNASFYLKFFSSDPVVCPKCNILEMKYLKAAQSLLKEQDFYMLFAEIEAPLNQNLTEKFQIKSMPSIFLLTPKNNYDPKEYRSDDYSVEALVENFLSEINEPRELKNYTEFNNRYLYLTHPFVFVLIKDQSKKIEFLKSYISEFPFVRVYYTYSYEEFREKFQIEYTWDKIIIIIKNPKISKYPMFIVKPMEADYSILILYTYFSPIEYCNNLTDYISKENQTALGKIMFNFDNFIKRDFDRIFANIMEVTSNYKFDLAFCIEDLYDQKLKKYEKLGIDKNSAFYIFYKDNKYKYNGDIIQNDDVSLNSQGMNNFIADYLKGIIKPFKRSAKITSTKNSKFISPLNGNNFDKFTKNKTKDVFVRISDKNLCTKSIMSRAENAFLSSAKEFLNLPDVIFAEIDISENDIPLDIEKKVNKNQGSIFAFIKNKKYNPIKFGGNITSSHEIIEFVKLHMTKVEYKNENLEL